MIGAFAIVSFLSCYNRYLWPLLVTSQTNMRVVQVGITSLQDQDAPQTIGLALAAVFIVSLPTFIIFVVGHKQLVKGLMAGAVKG
jgi:sn-glycerol 3-phosphate transport system permease protein